jgi:Transmembrane secretion effector
LVSGFFSGTLADRIHRGLLMRVVNLAGLLATVGLVSVFAFRPGGSVALPGPSGFYLATWTLATYPLYAVVIVGTTIFRPAFNSSLPLLTTRDRLSAANGLAYAVAAVLAGVGLFAVGVLLTVYPEIWALALPLGFLIVTQLALSLIRTDLSVRPRSELQSFATEAVEGYRYLFRRRELFELTIGGLLINFLTAIALVELALYVVSWLTLTQGFWYASLAALVNAGTAVGFVTIAQFRFERYAGKTILAQMILLGIFVVGLALTRSIWLAYPLIFLYGLMSGMSSTVFLSTVQGTVPNEMLGRVFAADEVGSYALIPVGQSAGGLITVTAGIQGTYLIAGGGIIVVTAGMVAGFRRLRQFGFSPLPSTGTALPPGVLGIATSEPSGEA